MIQPSIPGVTINLQPSLEDAIIRCDDVSTLHTLLGRQASVAAPSPKLSEHLRRFIDQPVPGLTAAVFRVYRYTGSDDAAIHASAAGYLTLSRYRGAWYDETINSIGWANELLKSGTESPLIPAYRELLDEAAEQDEQDLIDFCSGY